MSRKTFGRLAFLVLALGLVYGGLDLAGAAPGGNSSSVTVANTSSNPVPVEQQGTATVNVANATLPTHEQGTANVKVTNSSPLTVAVTQPSPITSGATIFIAPTNAESETQATYTATALQIHLTAGVKRVSLYTDDVSHPAAAFFGPGEGADGNIELALTRPISFNHIDCEGGSGPTDFCEIGMIGDSP